LRRGEVAATYAAVALGGALGGLAREGLVAAGWTVSASALPMLLAINAAGSALMGLLFAFSEIGGRRRLPPIVSLGAMAGFCGALTTFSTFALEVSELGLVGEPFRALLWVCLAPPCWLLAAALGLSFGRHFNRARAHPSLGLAWLMRWLRPRD